jgi:universal stress protein A
MYQRILVAIDLSEEAHTLLERAAALAHEHSAILDVVHVMDWPLTGFDPVMGYSPVSDDSLLESMATAVRKVTEKHGVDESHTHTMMGQPSGTVAQLAAELKSDLLIVGSHGRRGWRALLGSTASAIMQIIQCDCLLVRIKV